MILASRDASEKDETSEDGDQGFFLQETFDARYLYQNMPAIYKGPGNSVKNRPKRNLKSIYEVVAPGSTIVKVILSRSKVKEPGRPIVTVGDSNVAETCAHF